MLSAKDITRFHSEWAKVMATSVTVPAVSTMVERRLSGRRAILKKEMRTFATHGIQWTQEQLDATVDALIESTQPAPVQQKLPSEEATKTPEKREASPAPMQQKLQSTTWAHVASDARFVLAMLWAFLCGLWGLGRTVGNVTVELSPALLMIAGTVGAVVLIAAVPTWGISGAALALWAWWGA